MAKTKTELRAKRKQKEEELTNRILLVFGLSLAALLLLMLLNRLLIADNGRHMITVSYGCLFAALTIAAASLAGLIYMAVLWKRSPGSVWVGRLLHITSIALLFAGALALIYRNQYEVFPLLYVVLISVAVLYLVYNIYQRDFFVQAVVTGCAALTLYGFSRLLGKSMLSYIGYGAATLLLIGALGVTYYISRRRGMLGGLRLLPANANFPLMYVTYLALNAALLAALLIGAAFSFWAMIGVLGYLFVLAVYYTVKLM
ncbi:MAG: hypothetical protein FWH06_01690 [Oscillospiraceae bacterium]|nr:hypothetical protein [Oscillospiraceae bacterium]